MAGRNGAIPTGFHRASTETIMRGMTRLISRIEMRVPCCNERARDNPQLPGNNEQIDWNGDNAVLFIYSFHPISLCATERDDCNLFQGFVRKDTSTIINLSICIAYSNCAELIDIGNLDCRMF